MVCYRKLWPMCGTRSRGGLEVMRGRQSCNALGRPMDLVLHGWGHSPQKCKGCTLYVGHVDFQAGAGFMRAV